MQTFKEFLKENTNENMDFTEVMIIYEIGKKIKGYFKPDEKFDNEIKKFREELYKAEPILSDMCYYELGREEIQKKPGMDPDEWMREEIIRLYSPSSDPVHTFLVDSIRALYFDTITRPDSADIEFCEENFPRLAMLLAEFWEEYRIAAWKQYYIADCKKNRSKLALCDLKIKYFEDAFWFSINIFNPL